MIRVGAVLALVAWAGAAAAQPFPGRFDVTGVAAGDALNLRAGPSAGAAVVGRLAPDARGVEVLGLSPDGRWARVARPEGEGWAALRFLAEPAGAPARGLPLPLPLRCLGTEPFWTVTLNADGTALWETPDERRDLRPIGRALGLQTSVMAFDDGGATRDVTVTRAECSDGMSDRPYGFAALVWDRDGGVLEGCCRLL